eukprot:GABV01002694.1.p1 GENE.GABV01002694.1~~GABV01002694.1.p1  ORF type:complete len:116 (-),score=28.89 GABV01002694.1:109-456(-)
MYLETCALKTAAYYERFGFVQLGQFEETWSCNGDSNEDEDDDDCRCFQCCSTSADSLPTYAMRCVFPRHVLRRHRFEKQQQQKHRHHSKSAVKIVALDVRVACSASSGVASRAAK